MEGTYNNLTQKRRSGVLTVSFSGLAFFVLCIYLALLFLCYVEWIPMNMVSYALYGFAILSLIALLVKGSVIVGPHAKWYGLITALCAVSCLYSWRTDISISMVKEMLKLLLFSFLFTCTVNCGQRMEKAILSAVVGSVLLFLHLSSTGALEVDERLGESLTGNANTFAGLFMVGAICSVYFVYFSKKKLHSICGLIAFILQMYALAMSGGRKYFLLPLLLIGSLKMFRTDRNGRKTLAKNLLISVCVLLVTWWAIFNVKELYDLIGYRMEGLLNALTGEGKVDASTQIRQDMIDVGIRMWKQSPLIGFGIDTFKVLSGYRWYSHNNYVELLCSLGIVGLIAYYWFYVWLIREFYREKELADKRWYWIITLICMLVFDYGAVCYYLYPSHLVLLFACTALQLGRKKNN